MSVLEKFRRIEYNFNKNFLICLYQVRQIVEDEEDEKDVEIFNHLDRAYDHWFNKLQQEPRCMDACLRFHHLVSDYDEMLRGRDTQVFTINGDFFTELFNDKYYNEEKGREELLFDSSVCLDTSYLYDCLSDGLDEDDDEEESEDAKGNLWTVIIGLYRLCVLICIYLQTPLVKDIIDMILINNPDLNQRNIFDKITKNFMGNRRLRKLIMKLLKSKEDNFGDIFNSLQKVIGTFSDEVNIDTNMKKNMETAKKKIAELFDSILNEANVTTLNDEERRQLIEALEDNRQDTLQDFVEEKRITQTELDTIQQLYKQRGLDKMNVTKVVKNLGSTMEKMMAAIETNDEDAMKNILSSVGSGMNLDSEQLEKMQAEMKMFEEEEDLSDDDDEKKQ